MATLMQAAFTEPIELPAGKMIRCSFLVGGGKKVRQKYSETLSKDIANVRGPLPHPFPNADRLSPQRPCLSASERIDGPSSGVSPSEVQDAVTAFLADLGSSFEAPSYIAGRLKSKPAALGESG